MINSTLFRASTLALALAAAPFNSAQATGNEFHHHAPHQSGVKINKPVLTPVEEKFAALRNDINALRKAKTARERNLLLNTQSANLDALEALITDDPATAPISSGNDISQDQVNRLEHRVNRLEMILERMMRQRAWRQGQDRNQYPLPDRR